MLKNVKMPTIVGILTFMSMINFVLSRVVYNNSFFACGDFCHLLITFANILDPDHEGEIGRDLDPNHLTLMLFLK